MAGKMAGKLSRLGAESLVRNMLDRPDLCRDIADGAYRWLAMNADFDRVCREKIEAVRLLAALADLAVDGRLKLED
jgi:hypothetical protein